MIITKVHVLPNDLLVGATLHPVLGELEFGVEDAQGVHICHQVTTRLQLPHHTIIGQMTCQFPIVSIIQFANRVCAGDDQFVDGCHMVTISF